MGKKTLLSKEYQTFLNLAKSNYGGKGKKNFFNYENVMLLKNALDAEIKNTKEIVQNMKNISVNTAGVEKKFLNKVGQVSNLVDRALTKFAGYISDDLTMDSRMDDLEYIKQLRTELNKNEHTPFLKFAEKAKTAVNDYLNFVTTYELSIGGVEAKFNALYNALIEALKEYRHKAKSHHYFRSSVGRAEIANKLTGGSLELWLNNSFKALSKVGTEVKVDKNGYKYICEPKSNQGGRKKN